MKISNLEPQKGRTWPLCMTVLNCTLADNSHWVHLGLELPGDKVTSRVFWEHCSVCTNFRSKDRIRILCYFNCCFSLCYTCFCFLRIGVVLLLPSVLQTDILSSLCWFTLISWAADITIYLPVDWIPRFLGLEMFSVSSYKYARRSFFKLIRCL